MKLRLKNILTIAALLLSTSTWAQEGAANKFSVIYQLEGAQSNETAAGTVTGSISGTTATLTVTPAEGNYITIDDITVYKIINGQYAQARGPQVDVTPVALTATTTNGGPDGTTTYTFDVTDEVYNYEVTANFHARTNISGATVTLAQTSYPYTSEAIEPEVTVTSAAGTALTIDVDYTIAYTNNINVPASENDGQPTITITGIGKYMGTKTVTFTITKGQAIVTVAPVAKDNLTYTGEAQALINEGTATNGTMQYKLGDNGTYGTAIPTGTAAGEYTVYYKAVAIDTNNYDDSEEGSVTATIGKDAGTISYATTSVNKTYGDDAFTNALTITGDGTVSYASGNTAVATVNASTGEVTIKGAGEATITATVADKDGGNYTYATKTATYTLTVAKVTAVVTTAPTAKENLTYTGEAQALINEGTATNGTMQYKVGDNGTYSATIPTGTEAGEYTVYYKAVATNANNYDDSEEGSITVTIGKGAGTISYAETSVNKAYGDAAFTNALTNTGDGTVTYASDDTKVANVNAQTGQVTITGPGEATITATVTDGNNYTYATKTATYTLTVEGAEKPALKPTEPTLTWSAETATVSLGGDYSTLPTLTNPYGISVTYNSSNTNVATISTDGTITILAVGTTTISAVFDGNEEFTAKTVSYTLTVEEAQEPEPQPQPVEPTLGWVDANQNPVDAVTVTLEGDYSALPTLNNPENLAVTYTSSETSVATVDENGAVDILAAGTTTIKAAFAGSTVYEAAEATYTLTVSKAKTELKFSATTAQATMNAEFQAPTLTKSPENLEGVEFTSSNEAAATVDKNTGAVTLVGAGETTIKAAFAGSTVYEASEASYTLTVNRAASEGYLLWVNDTQVTSDNAEDVLGHINDSSKPVYIYNKDKKQLLIDNDQTRTTVIESRMPELTVYIKDANKIKRIFFNNTGDASNKGNLTFTTNGNFPGKLIIANPTKGESAIKGFSNISYNWDLTTIEPDGSFYDTTTLEMKYKDETGAIVIADTITIGEAIVPITEKRAITFEESQLVEKDEDGNVKRDESGNPIKANLSNYSYAPASTTGEPEKNVIHISLNPANIGENAGGFDIEDGIGGIYIEDTMTDAKAGQVAQDVQDNRMVPGGTLFADSYDGFTFKVIAGSGTIEIDEIVENDHEFHLIIGINKPITLNEDNSIITRYDGNSVRVQAEIAFNVGVPTYCFLYMVKKTAGARGVTPIGKRDTAHGKVISISVKVSKSIDTNPPSEASGGVLPEDEDPVVIIDDTDGVKEIIYTDRDRVGNDRWYNLKGQKIDEPTKKGLYIRNRKKIYVK